MSPWDSCLASRNSLKRSPIIMASYRLTRQECTRFRPRTAHTDLLAMFRARRGIPNARGDRGIADQGLGQFLCKLGRKTNRVGASLLVPFLSLHPGNGACCSIRPVRRFFRNPLLEATAAAPKDLCRPQQASAGPTPRCQNRDHSPRECATYPSALL